jgi:dTDP-4-dehydrorhamnose reductase
MKVAILGNGWIGNRLAEHLDGVIIPRHVYSIAELDAAVKDLKPDVLINAVASNGGDNVDCCEIDKDGTLFANTLIPIMAAEVAIRNKVKLVHISSGCVYDGCLMPLTEEDPPNFFDLFYSRTKIYSEGALVPMADKYGFLILRPRIPLDNRPHPRNILTKLIQYGKVIDEPNSVTYLPDFLNAVQALLRDDAHGVFNVVNDGTLRYPDLMEIYKEYVPEYEYTITTLQDLGIVRTNVILDTSKLNQYCIYRNINSVLKDCVRDYVEWA